MSIEASSRAAEQPEAMREAATRGGLAKARRDHQVTQAFEQSRKLFKGCEPVERANAVVIHDAMASRPASSRLKRLIDVVGAGFGLVFLAPFLLLVALIIQLEGHGPVLFRQRRKGRGGVPFVIYKFRTMRCLEDGPEIRQAQRDDGRTTWFGAFLRRSSIDELPQLLNVLKGEMSLVGPRPHALAHDEFYGAAVENYDARFVVRPGISGLAQVSGLRGATPSLEWMAARVALDLEYIRRWSIGLDIRILWRTVLIGPFDPGAF
jgi:putative colanic acid biosynthesis UDP-glucose lipid carrier transferase